MREWVSKEDIKENGHTGVIIRSKEGENEYTLRGLRKKENQNIKLFERLLQLKAITLVTCLLRFFKLESNIWNTIYLKGFSFNSEDTFLLTVDFNRPKGDFKRKNIMNRKRTIRKFK